MIDNNQIKDHDFFQDFEIDGIRLIVSASRSYGILVYDETVQHFLGGNERFLTYSPRIGTFKSIDTLELKSEALSFIQYFGGSLNRDLIHERLQNIVEHYSSRKTEAIQDYLAIPLPPKKIGPDEFLARFRPLAFFHFTDTRNLPSIREHGLCSLAEIERRNIPVAAYGGDEKSREIDKFKGLDRFVHLCFHASHNLEIKARIHDRRIEQSVFISVSPEIVRSNVVRFTPTVAYSKGCPLLPMNQAINEMDFQVIYDGLDRRDPEINMRFQETRKYEILVPILIQPEFLTFPNHG
jgi:hypothetical protein